MPCATRRRKKIELKFTRHGPVILEDPKNHRAYAARVGWLDAGMSPYFGSIEYMRAKDWREFAAALNRWGAPSENQVYADIDGNIGYKPVGLFPKRTNWDGLLPVPGDGRYEWDGYFDMDALPRGVQSGARLRRYRERNESAVELSDCGSTHRLRMVGAVARAPARRGARGATAPQLCRFDRLATRLHVVVGAGAREPAADDRRLARTIDATRVGRRAVTRLPRRRPLRHLVLPSF